MIGHPGQMVATAIYHAESGRRFAERGMWETAAQEWAEARAALLATHTGSEPLSHEHGFPLRLVAPGHRGFEWVKWITRIEVLTEPDSGQVISIFTSSFTDAGRGK